jgi:hypothetical protein
MGPCPIVRRSEVQMEARIDAKYQGDDTSRKYIHRPSFVWTCVPGCDVRRRGTERVPHVEC